MRKCVVTAVAVALSSFGVARAQEPGAVPQLEVRSEAAPADLKGEDSKVSYCLGLSQGRQLKNLEITLSQKDFLKGLVDGMTGGKAALTDQEMADVMQKFQSELQARMLKKIQEMAAKNKQEGDEFLAKNKAEKGVTTTRSGLQFKVLKAGSGPKPKATDTVKTHYAGKLLDGTEFDSSIARGEPATFPVNRVIKGWQEALSLMPVGSKFQVWVPAALAYGPDGNDSIPPNATLAFEIELLGIEKPSSQLPGLDPQ
ncbi:MAG: FKBP-type peptidyl-prolyl cis-trans isomerase [Pirellulales bacterium]